MALANFLKKNTAFIKLWLCLFAFAWGTALLAQTPCLKVSATVQTPAKCGRNTGRVMLTVTGGSGNYTFSQPNAPNLTGLAGGTYTVLVQDRNSATCTGSVTFTVPTVQQPVADVKITPYNIVCPGRGLGFVSFEVIPGNNFVNPFTFVIQDNAGTSYQPDKLKSGRYTLQITDADGCTLRPDTFHIREPAPLRANPVVRPEDCTNGGRIILNLSGGNGDYKVDWADLPGFFNAPDRTNLAPGIYRGVVYDKLFCTDTIGTYLIRSNCVRRDTGVMAVATGKSATYCFKTPAGLSGAQAQYQLLNRSALGRSTFGSWVLSNSGCLQYTAGTRVRYGADTICIAQRVPALSLVDTLCLLVHITRSEPTFQTVYFTVQAGRSARTCGTIPADYTNVVVRQLDRSGYSGRSSFGLYDVDRTNACLTFSAFNQVGFNLDTFCTVVTDRVQVRSHTICYIPSVLPAEDCTAERQLADINVSTSDCAGNTPVCVPIPFNDILGYVIFDNGAPYANGYSGCNADTIVAYNVFELPPGGPYTLLGWNIGSREFSGPFANLDGLLALMNLLDPQPGWKLENNQKIVGGKVGVRYGPLRIQAASGQRASLAPNPRLVAQGTELRFAPGLHEVVLRRIPNGCADTLSVRINCANCPNIHAEKLDAQGGFRWRVSNCNQDTLFCTNILRTQADQYQFSDNGVTIPARDLGACGNYVGIRLDTGVHNLRLRHLLSPCTYAIRAEVICALRVTDEDAFLIAVGARESVCLDTGLISGPIVRSEIFCAGDNGVVQWQFNKQRKCIELVGLKPGTDTLCVRVCNALNDCFSYVLFVTVRNAADTATVAKPDQIRVPAREPTDIYVLDNDLIRGFSASPDGLSALTIVTPPRFGTAKYNVSTGAVKYTPNPEHCGADFFIYRLQDLQGKADTALVRIWVVCPQPQIYTGLSPNGDGQNDTWVVRGLEQYASHRVQVFNRWGNVVFTSQNYTDRTAWDGTWNGQALPDGTYYYVIDLGDGSPKLTGVLQLMR